MDWLAISSGVTAFATAVIAYYSYVSNKLSNAIRDQEINSRQALEKMTERHHNDLGDLYQAIVIATLIGGHSPTEQTIKEFTKLYSGDVEIFKADKDKR